MHAGPDQLAGPVGDGIPIGVEGIGGGQPQGLEAVVAERVGHVLPTGQAGQDEDVRGVVP